MNGFFGKLGFIHRRLWQQDGLYPAALLFGPALLLGALLAVIAWRCTLALERLTFQLPRWATPLSPDIWHNASGQPQSVQPSRALPPTGADGALPGYEAGWRVMAAPIQVSPALDVDVKPTALSVFYLDGPGFEMAQIIAGGPKGSLFVGNGLGLLAIRTPGIYALSVRVER